MAYIDIKNLSFSYPGSGGKALDNIDLSIEKGEFICLCGVSGSGKTTLLRQLKPALTPHGRRSGEVLLDGRSVNELSLREQSALIGYVMQDIEAQLVTDKVWHELAFGLESLGCEQQAMRLRVAEMASYFGIQSWFREKVCNLSGGQKQLLNLASVMAMQPEILILDEPTAQLDPIAASDFIAAVSRLNRDMGVTVILSEHRLEDVIPASDRVVVLENGRLAADGAPDEIGAALDAAGSDMISALPAPMRIWRACGSGTRCPVTVRDARRWLHAQCPEIHAEPAETKNGYPEPENAAVELKEVYFRYAKDLPDVLRGLDLTVGKGTFHAVVGGNGSGKSTLLKAICAEIRPYSGKILINGKRLEKYRDSELFRGLVSALPQNPKSLFVKKSVREELEEMGGDIEAAAKFCDLEKLLDMHPYDLSGGEQQRCALAKVLMTKPEILLLDEPTKGMDAPFKRAFAAKLRQLCNEGMTVLLVSHDIEFCAAYADTVSLMFDGAVVSTGDAKGFFAGNSFYTTAVNKMCRGIFPDAVTDADVIEKIEQAREKRE